MPLAAVKEGNFTRWMEHPTSSILHHDRSCCEEARLWFLSYARTMEIGSPSEQNIRAPSWLSKLFKWGPSQWPISWCDVVKEKMVDCGVFAALAREIFAAQGHQVHPAQALLHYNSECTSHWKDLWQEASKTKRDLFPWVGTEIVYHELCVLEMPDQRARVYDSTWGFWHVPYRRNGFGGLLAFRTECPRLLRWGDKTISCGEWIDP